MDGKMIGGSTVRFNDQRRYRSPVVSRAFSSAIRASSQGPQSEMTEPAEVSLPEPDAAVSNNAIVRGVD
jgi:hypothetical protein